MNLKLLLTVSLGILLTIGCKEPGNSNSGSGGETAPGDLSDFTQFEMPAGNLSFDIAIYPDGWTESGSPKLKQFKNVDEETVRSELSNLDWKTAGRYSGDDRHDVPEFILTVNGAYPQIRASGSTDSDADFQITCECTYVDENGMHHSFETPIVEDSSILPELFTSFLKNDDRWKTIVEWGN